MNRFICLAATLLIAGCQSGIYVRDGVTDGNAYFLPPRAFAGAGPAKMSWVRYNLMRSTCQLEVGGDNPARVHTYDCEFRARRHLVDAWLEGREPGEDREDPYLDTLVTVRKAGFLEEYTVHYFGRDSWQVPANLDADAFRRWRRVHLKDHRPETRRIGYWGYRDSTAELR